MMTVWPSSIWKSTTQPAEPKGIISSRKRALLPVAFRQLNGKRLQRRNALYDRIVSPGGSPFVAIQHIGIKAL